MVRASAMDGQRSRKISWRVFPMGIEGELLESGIVELEGIAFEEMFVA